jgi:hypothetical protein
MLFYPMTLFYPYPRPSSGYTLEYTSAATNEAVFPGLYGLGGGHPSR